MNSIPALRLPIRVRAVLAEALTLLFAAWLIAVSGEIIYRGIDATLDWLNSSPASNIVSALYLGLLIAGLRLALSLPAAIAVGALPFLIYSFANHQKLAKLGSSIAPSDLLLTRQYLDVVQILWGRHALWIGAFFAIGATIFIYRARKRIFRHAFPSIPASILYSCCAISFVLLIILPDYNFKNARFRASPIAYGLDKLGISNLNWDPETNTHVNGQLLSFLMNANTALIVPPPGHEETISAVVAEMRHPTLADFSKPNVVVIMNEAWWDPAQLPGITYSDPLFDALKSSTQGELFSPVFGGYTANTEFEFLTRLSNAYLPIGSIPYAQYVRRPTPSLASDFRTFGYETIAIHPFDKTFWNRDKVYAHLGFSRFDSTNNTAFESAGYGYVSDTSLASFIANEIGNPGAPKFIFAVTMHNHGPYLDGTNRYSGQERTEIKHPGTLDKDSTDILSTYATGVKDAVLGFNLLVESIQKSGKPTILIMFGDHLPFLGDDFRIYHQAGHISTANPAQWTSDDRKKMHTVPIVAWSNLSDIALPNELSSPIYLGTWIKRSIGMPLNGMDNALDRLRSTHPVIARDRDYMNMPPASQAMAQYRAIQYDILFGDDRIRTVLDSDQRQ